MNNLDPLSIEELLESVSTPAIQGNPQGTIPCSTEDLVAPGHNQHDREEILGELEIRFLENFVHSCLGRPRHVANFLLETE
jgi:hypothetical protein